MVHLQLGGELGGLFVRCSVLCTMRQMGGAGVSILPWSARLGSELERVAQFSTLVLEEGTLGRWKPFEMPKKGFQI